MQSRLGELGLQSIDVGAGAGDCFFIIHNNNNNTIHLYSAINTNYS